MGNASSSSEEGGGVLGTRHEVIFKPYIDHVDGYETTKGSVYHKQPVKVQLQPMTVVVPDNAPYGPINVHPPPVKVTIHGSRTLPSHRSPTNVTTKIKINARPHRFWPPSLSLRYVPPHYRDRAYHDQRPEDRTELVSVPLPRPLMSWRDTVAGAPKPQERQKPNIRRTSHTMRKIKIGPVRVGERLEELDTSDDSDDEALLGAVGGCVDPKANTGARASMRLKRRTRRRIVNLQPYPRADQNLVRVDQERSPIFDSVFRARRHSDATALRDAAQEEEEYFRRCLEGRQRSRHITPDYGQITGTTEEPWFGRTRAHNLSPIYRQFAGVVRPGVREGRNIVASVGGILSAQAMLLRTMLSLIIFLMFPTPGE